MLMVIALVFFVLAPSLVSAQDATMNLLTAVGAGVFNAPVSAKKLNGARLLINKTKKIEGKCMDETTQLRFRTEEVDEDMVRQNLATASPDVGQNTILRADLVQGVTCWYLRAQIVK